MSRTSEEWMNCNWQFVVENWPSLVADLAACEKERDEFKMAMLDAADRAEKAEAELAECQRLQPCDCGRAVDVDGNRIHYPPCVYSELAALRQLDGLLKIRDAATLRSSLEDASSSCHRIGEFLA